MQKKSCIIKKTHFLLLLISILFIACNNPLESDKNVETNKYKKISFEKVKEIELPLENKASSFYPIVYDYKIIDEKETFIIYRKDIKKLVFYDLKTKKKFNEIKLDFRELNDFEYINKDSILLFYINQYNKNNYVKNQLLLINFEGEIKQNYIYDNKNVWCENNKTLSEDSAFYPHLFANKIELINNKMFMFLDKQKVYDIGVDSFFINRSPIISYFDLNTSKLITSKKLWYPFLKEGDYYPSDFPIINYCLSKDSFPLIRFFYSSKLFKWNYLKDEVVEYSLKSRLIDTIPPMPFASRYSDKNIPAMYLNMSYDKYREYYYSAVLFSPSKYGWGAWSFIIADKNLNYVGEVFAPKFISFRPIFTKDYIISIVPSKKEGIININFFKMKLHETDYSGYINSLKDSLKNREKKIINKTNRIAGTNTIGNKTDIINYLNNKIKIKEKTYAVISIYLNDGCPGCKTKVLNFIAANQNILDSNSLYLNISGRNSSDIIKYLRNHNILNYKKLYVDTLDEYTLFDNFGLKNPRLTLVEEKRVTYDTTYYPDGIDAILVPKLLEHLRLRKE